ncbi:MAG TPA: methanogenesis marker 9 domain-containing protein [Methanocorpusculum sp.]|nr:methanogenesis marker 9 domain-containing protein [Methanocorpusculum sp.]
MPQDTMFLTINKTPLKTPIVLASMAGSTDAEYALARKNHLGAAFLGGFNIDTAAQKASEEIKTCGRKEFDHDLEQIAAEAKKLQGTGILCGLNLRGKDPAAFLAAAEKTGAAVVYEIDAHCRQKPMTDAGCGEALLTDTDTLCNIVTTLAKAGYTVSVKFRAGIVNDADLAHKLWKAGASILHVDCMDFGHAKIRQIRNACPLILIANNGVDSPDTMMDYFSHGADLVSVARHSDSDTLKALDYFITETAKSVGWYNAPKQLCRGGDIRSLAFCCMPVKSCPLLPFLEKTGLAREEYLELKKVLTADTPLAEGSHTCFGSLAFCCKTSTPCMFREMITKAIGLENDVYMDLKRRLGTQMMNYVFSKE